MLIDTNVLVLLGVECAHRPDREGTRWLRVRLVGVERAKLVNRRGLAQILVEPEHTLEVGVFVAGQIDEFGLVVVKVQDGEREFLANEQGRLRDRVVVNGDHELDRAVTAVVIERAGQMHLAIVRINFNVDAWCHMLDFIG